MASEERDQLRDQADEMRVPLRCLRGGVVRLAIDVIEGALILGHPLDKLLERLDLARDPLPVTVSGLTDGADRKCAGEVVRTASPDMPGSVRVRGPGLTGLPVR